jgi:hypothetical protein
MSRLRVGAFAGLLAMLAAAAQTRAQEPSPPAPAPPPPPPYALPWLLRPAAAGTVARLDSTLALFENAGGSGSTFVESVIVSYKASPTLAPLFRVSLVHNDPPGSAASGGGISNPLLGVNYVRPLGGGWRLSLFGASTIPVGSGGGDSPDPAAQAAMSAAIPARSAMDNALFAVNYWTLVGGGGIARVTRGLTLQAEATVLELIRVRGPESQDAFRTNFTAGLHVGRFFGPRFSLGGELRIQRWLTDAAPVRSDPAARETLTFGVGPRAHFRLAGRMVRPGLSWSRALDDPLAKSGYDIFAFDVPVAF